MRIVGAVELSGRSWAITCEPHVAIKLKRYFAKIDNRDHGTYFLSDTPENARDLDWFLQRFAMRVSDADADTLKRRSVLHREQEATVAGLLSKRRRAKKFNLALPARDYQEVAARLALETRGMLLADDVGLGKTISAICMLTDPRTRPAVVVTMTHLPLQWQAEITRFAPTLRSYIVKTGVPTPHNLSLFAQYPPDVIIINYHKLRGWADVLALFARSIVFDEVQELRRRESEKYAAAQHIAQAAEYRIGLSATPIYNFGSEFWNVLNVLRPDSLGTYAEFRREWCTEENWRGDQAHIGDTEAFGTYIRESGLMLRRTRKEVKRELPPLSTIPYHIDADTSVLEKVSKSCAELARLILREGPEQRRGEKLIASEEFSNRLRQATGIAKAPFVAQFVKLLVESGERVLLYGWHRAVYAIWQELLAELKPVMFTGTESPTRKEAAKQSFIKRLSPVLIMSLRAGQGLDGLQGHCRMIVIGELDWSPGVIEQCIGRVWRDGQEEPASAYFPVTDCGSDPIMSDVLGLKKQQLEGVINPGRALVEKLTVDPNHIKQLAASYLQQVAH